MKIKLALMIIMSGVSGAVIAAVMFRLAQFLETFLETWATALVILFLSVGLAGVLASLIVDMFYGL